MELRRQRSELSRLQREIDAIVEASPPVPAHLWYMDAYTLAKASMYLDALKQAKTTGLAPSHPDYSSLEVGEPSAELLAKAQRAIDARWTEERYHVTKA
jgi:hypothetical protein